MFTRLGAENRLDRIVFLLLVLLVAVTPLGNEATQPAVLGVYRTLLLLIAGIAAYRTRQLGLPQTSARFLTAVGTVIVAMFASVVLRAGAHFEGIYYFYQNVLFLVAFISLASYSRTRTFAWKNAVLGMVVFIDIVYLTAVWIRGIRPFQATFVNPNYFASYLLVGFAICIAGAFFARTAALRLAAIAAGLYLFLGIGQTSSRGVFLSMLALLTVGLFRMARQHGFPLWRSAIVALLVIGIAAAANPSLIRKFSDRGQHDIYNYGRTQIWMKTISMIGSHPLNGVGIGRFYYVSKLFTPAVDGAIGRYRRWPNIAHSEYLQYTAEIGIPAALLMFGIGAFLFHSMWRRAESVEPESRISQEAAILTAIGLGIHAVVDNNWTVPVAAAGLAVISLSDLLPYRQRPFEFQWTPMRLAALTLFTLAVFIQAVQVPFLALYFNETGHKAYIAGDFKRAEQLHRLALGFVPDHPVMLDNLGMVYFDEYIKVRKPEYLDRAESLFRDSMAANPSFDIPAGHLETALLQRLTGDPARDQPIHHLIVAADRLGLQANPYNPFIRKNLAEALFNIGNKQEAVEELQKAVAIEPNFVQGYLRLAQWEDGLGHPEAAVQYRTRANNVTLQFRDRPTPDPFEALLLDRNIVQTGKP